jgi:RNA polymerase sigma-70 factor, ECF subfamily
MDVTSPSLLLRAREGSAPAWERLADLYRPLIYHWLLRHSLTPHDADDLSQDVLATLVKELPRFQHGGRPGAFRTWLRVITVNRARAFWRARSSRPQGSGDSGVMAMVEQLEDPASDLSGRWDREHDERVLRHLLGLMETEFEPNTVRAFRRLTLEGASAAEVAAELGMTVGAVYVAKSRVLRRLREEGEGLLD